MLNEQRLYRKTILVRFSPSHECHRLIDVQEVMTGNIPFEKLSDMVVCSEVLLKKSCPARPLDSFPLKTQHGNQLWTLISLCWSSVPLARPQAAFVVEKVSILAHLPKTWRSSNSILKLRRIQGGSEVVKSIGMHPCLPWECIH
jgi:hypothetical protein